MSFIGRMNSWNHTQGPFWAKLLKFTSTAEPRTPSRIFLWWHLFKSYIISSRKEIGLHSSLTFLTFPFSLSARKFFQICGWETASVSAVGIFQFHERASLETISTLALQKERRKKKKDETVRNDGDSKKQIFLLPLFLTLFYGLLTACLKLCRF